MAVTKFLSGPKEGDKNINEEIDVLTVPLLALEKVYADFSKQSIWKKKELIDVLTHQLLQNVAQIENDFEFVFQEFSSSLNTKGDVDICENIKGKLYVSSKINFDESNCFFAEKLMNLSTKRKVFEDENPNPYEEKLIIIQAQVATITKLVVV